MKTLDKKCIIVDIDGTIANCEHRLKYVKTKPRQWKKFLDEAINDTPYTDIIWLVKTLKAAGCSIVFLTARSEDEKATTKKWIKEIAKIEDYDGLYMRESGDFRDDSVIKLELLENVRNDGHVPFMILDDRNRVVEMWRNAGIRCLQVREGDF